MEESNIDLFNESVGIVLAELYRSFPSRSDLVFNDLAIEMFNDDDNDGTYLHKYEIFSATVKWLEQAGYIGVATFNEHGSI